MDTLLQDLFTFEMANNHQGQVEHGLKIIDHMAQITARTGIRSAVKFQYRHLDTFIHPDYKGRTDIKHIPRFEGTRLTDKEFVRMGRAVRKGGMLWMVTPFDEASVRKCIEQDVDIIKVASCSAKDWPLLEAIAAAGKPAVASTGGLAISDIDNLATFFTRRVPELSLMHCVSL